MSPILAADVIRPMDSRVRRMNMKTQMQAVNAHSCKTSKNPPSGRKRLNIAGNDAVPETQRATIHMESMMRWRR